MEEIWKDIEGYEGLYQISNLGNVKSLYSNPPIILKPGKDKHGYLYVILSRNGGSKVGRIHRLVANSFIPNIYNKEQVNHINGIKTDNTANNLEWVTNSENMRHAVLNGLRADVSGNKNPNCRKINQLDLNEQFIKQWSSIYDICKEFNINRCAIWRCCVGKTKQSNNFIWRYAD